MIYYIRYIRLYMRSGVDGDIMESFDTTAAGIGLVLRIYVFTYMYIYVYICIYIYIYIYICIIQKFYKCT